jgi:ABC-type branched-subunit amino acid transport system substrate-binding protein
VSKYTLDCNVASPPNQVEQGVLQNKAAGVTHVLLASSETNDQNYVRIANGQGFHPQYLVTDYGATTSGSGTGNWDSSFDGAVGVTTTRVGEFSSGVHNAQAVTCDKVLRAHGVNGVQNESKDTSALAYCDMFSLVRQALDNAGANPTQVGFPQALSTMGLYRSAVGGDGSFSRPGKITGGDFERQIIYRSSCGCWRIVERTMTPISR